MKRADLQDLAEFVTDKEGNPKVQLDPAIWEEILTLLEDLEDVEEPEQAIREEGEFVTWEELFAGPQTESNSTHGKGPDETLPGPP